MRLKFKQLADHKADCFALEAVSLGTWPTPWAYLERTEPRDSIGRLRRDGRRWWYMRCNDPSCPAAITVNENEILDFIGAVGLETAS